MFQGALVHDDLGGLHGRRLHGGGQGDPVVGPQLVDRRHLLDPDVHPVQTAGAGLPDPHHSVGDTLGEEGLAPTVEPHRCGTSGVGVRQRHGPAQAPVVTVAAAWHEGNSRRRD